MLQSSATSVATPQSSSDCGLFRSRSGRFRGDARSVAGSATTPVFFHRRGIARSVLLGVQGHGIGFNADRQIGIVTRALGVQDRLGAHESADAGPMRRRYVPRLPFALAKRLPVFFFFFFLKKKEEEIIMNARDVMTRPAYTCRLDTTLDEASRFMEENACGTLIVLDGAGRLAGILTDRDLAMTIGRTESRPPDLPVVGAMTRNVHTCSPTDDLSVALERMSDAKVRRLPVVDAGGKVQGMLSIDDIVLWGLGHYGVKKKVLVNALRSICAFAEPDVRDRGCRGLPCDRQYRGVTAPGDARRT